MSYRQPSTQRGYIFKRNEVGTDDGDKTRSTMETSSASNGVRSCVTIAIATGRRRTCSHSWTKNFSH